MNDPLLNAKSIFQNLAKFEPNWLKFKKILEKIGNFVQNLAQNGLLFLEKLVFAWVLLSNSVAAHPYQNQT